MTNEISAGLGVRQPVSQIGGSSPFGVNKLLFLNQNFNGFANDGSGNSGVILQSSFSLGTVAGNMVIQLWNLMLRINLLTNVTSAVAYLDAKLLVRDSTVQSTVTLAQAIAATSGGGFAGSPKIPAVGTPTGKFVTTNYFINWDYLAYPPPVGGASRADDYGNTISAGDSLVADFLVWAASQTASNQTGTYDAGTWFTQMFLP